MKQPSESTLNYLKENYPVNARVRLVIMNDLQAPPTGTEGTVRFVDDMGTIHVRWDNGSGLGVVYEEDYCSVIGTR